MRKREQQVIDGDDRPFEPDRVSVKRELDGLPGASAPGPASARRYSPRWRVALSGSLRSAQDCE